jgi:cytidyltransferase-like protein
MIKPENTAFILPNYPADDRYEDITFVEKPLLIPTDRPVRIYCDGIFDMFHYGHARLFSQVKQMFPNVTLVVGICNDELTTKYKGALVMNETERYESVRQCKFVDEVIEDAPWTLDMEYLKKHKIDLVAHDEAPYPTPNSTDCYTFVKKIGMFLPTKRATKISTTKIITGIIKNYDIYLRRQLLRGISYKELNISFFKKEQIRFKSLLNEDLEKMKEELKEALDFWENLTKKWFNRIFERDNSSVFSKMLSIVKNNKRMKHY